MRLTLLITVLMVSAIGFAEFDARGQTVKLMEKSG